MCQKCVDACREVFPEVPDDEMFGFLFGTTVFPFAHGDTVREMLLSNRSKMVGDDWHECFAIADDEDRRAIDALRSTPCPECGEGEEDDT